MAIQTPDQATKTNRRTPEQIAYSDANAAHRKAHYEWLAANGVGLSDDVCAELAERLREATIALNALESAARELEGQPAEAWNECLSTELTAEQAVEFEAIVAAEPTDDSQRLADRFIGSCSYTTTALKAMAAWLASVDDAEGASMVLRFAAEMARHEAVTL